MQTLRKLPTAAPSTAAIRMTNPSTGMAHLVQQDTGSDGDVERFRTTSERDRDPLPCQAHDGRAHTRPFVADHYGDACRALGTTERDPFHVRSPEIDVFPPSPRPHLILGERHDRQSEGGPHRSPQHLGVAQVGGTRQEQGPCGAEREGGADEGADVAGILHRIEHEHRAAGVEIEIVAMPQVPVNFAFLIDTTKVRMRAKKGRKGIMEKLGKMGDFERYQILSEFTMEMRGYNQGQHGLFTRLA